MTTCLGKSCAGAFRKLLSIYVLSYFPFGFEGRMWDLIVSVPDHCLSFYFVEKVHLNLVQNMLDVAQNKLQRGFTKGTSPMCGSLLLTEAIAESTDIGKALHTAFIDVSKAFDIVWHDSILVKLYDVGLNGQKWNFLNNWYTGIQSSVKWDGEISLPFPECQGVRQGGVWSPTGYKHFLNPLLDSVTKHKAGLHIGSIYFGVVGVADDLLFMADTPEELKNYNAN